MMRKMKDVAERMTPEVVKLKGALTKVGYLVARMDGRRAADGTRTIGQIGNALAGILFRSR